MHKILIINDDRDSREKTLLLLESASYQVFTAENSWLGLEIVREELPDLIICKASLPEINGYSILSTIQAEEITAQIGFILLAIAWQQFAKE
jgi:CheY-like chemotaxis protein